MSDDLLEWTFCEAVFRTRSVTQAAKELKLRPAVASSRLLSLEKRLGRQLFHRESRPFSPTADARAIHEDVRGMLASRRRIEESIARSADEGSAVLRVMIGSSFRSFAPRLIMQYARRHPLLRLNLIVPADISEFLADKADVIAVSGPAEMPDCVMLSRGRMLFVPIASPGYLKENGPLDSCSALQGQRIFSNLYADRFSFSVTYPLKKGSQLVTVRGIETVRWSSVDMALQAVKNGLGVSPSMPLFHCIDDLEKGLVVPILNGWHRPCQENFIACRKAGWSVPHIRAFTTWWAGELLAHEQRCEARLEKLFGKAFLEELST